MGPKAVWAKRRSVSVWYGLTPITAVVHLHLPWAGLSPCLVISTPAAPAAADAPPHQPARVAGVALVYAPYAKPGSAGIVRGRRPPPDARVR